jgi:hypothetical protein
MPRKRKRQKRAEEEHTHLAIRVERFEASVEASVNHNVYTPNFAWDLDDDDPLHQFTTRLTLIGVATYPENRVGDAYELILYGDNSRRLSARVKDVQARDKHGSPEYRSYRGREIPVYNPPSGMGLLDKIRGEPRWTAWLHVSPRFTSDALALLSKGRSLFLAIHECKRERARWVRSVRLQTNDPAEE